ncbi:hypothetical protein K9U40_04740 [Xanthobacter autotrophicus]|uniref:hypothetical protein n=1 Tax=Xanthobacter TaxID=279 RepID=UPI0024ABEDF8|nr:hypothetical protein [Xanthobacter autotrophicus]MDI4663643.1 hypothetical protein [Xanthobacter autotrophicus]
MTTFRTQAVRLAFLVAVAGAGFMASAGTSQAVVYCKTVGYPKGCVARPAAVVVRPAPVAGAVVVAPRRVIYCTRPGYPRGCVVR